MKIDDFLSRLNGVTSDGKGGWMACCPAHDDHNPSMHVNVGDDGRILVKCFAGCSTDDIVSSLGLEKRDLMADDGKKVKVSSQGVKRTEKAPPAVDAAALLGPLPSSEAGKKQRDIGRLVCEYFYQDENGRNVFKVQRRVKADGKKTFIQMHPDPNAAGGWGYGVEKAGVEYIPYQVPSIRKAAADGRTVIVCEGEKDVHTVIDRLHSAATCNAKGAGKWQAGFGKYFVGVPKVIIIADKDPLTHKDKRTGEIKPFAVGQRHACDVERKLRADGYEGEIVKIVMPDVEIEQGVLKHVKDFTDWSEAMDAAGRKADRAAFANVLKTFLGWPDEWNFNVEDSLDIQRAQREARDSASSSTSSDGDGEKRTDGRGEMGEAGRFGRLCPRAPLKERGFYQVDFQMDPGRIARINVGVDSIQFEGWQRSDKPENHGEFVLMASYDEIKCPACRMVSMAIGCMDSFDRHFKLANPQRTELTCDLALAWLRAHGKFFADVDNPMYSTSLYFDSREGVLYNIQSNEFQSFLATEANVSRENKVFKFMMALIEDMTLDRNITPRIRPSKEWDRVGDVIYVSNGDSRMYRISANRIDDVQNGTDGVVFLRGSTLEPFKLLEGPGVDPFVHSLLFKNAALEKPTDVMNCRLWTLNLFSCSRNKPILLVNGPRGSGKTFLVQGIKQFIGIRTNGQLDDTINRMDHTDKGAEAFWIIIDKGRFEIFDNFDYKIKWADNDLQSAATGGSHKTRELYKTDVLVTLYARSFIALTSNNPIFASEGGGLPDRIIKVGMIGRPKVSKGQVELKDDNMRNRDSYLTYIMRTISKALADDKPVDANINMRHPEFAEFAVRCGRALGCEADAVRALSEAETQKCVLPLVNDVVAKEIIKILMNQEKPGYFTFTPAEMSELIVRSFGDDVDEKTKLKYSSRLVGYAISKKFPDDFNSLFNIKRSVNSHRITTYEFTGLTEKAKLISTSLMCEYATQNCEFGESLTGKEEYTGLPKNVDLSRTVAHAHAQAQDVPFTREENSNGDIAGTDSSEDMSDFDF